MEVEGNLSDESKLEWVEEEEDEEEDVGDYRVIQWGEQELRLLDMVHGLIVGWWADIFEGEVRKLSISPLERH